MRSDQPNVVVITCHDLGRHLGCYGQSTVRSPRLDRLAAEGVTFDRAFCAAPQCSPSRAALFTGRSPHANGVMGLTHRDFAWDLDPDERHLGQVLRDAGYTTALIGVHHESRAGDPAMVRERCGMDSYLPHARGEITASRALEYLGERAEDGRPFYLQIGFGEPHRLATREREEPDYMGFIGDYLEPDVERGVAVPPWLADTPLARTEIAELQGAIRYVDARIGRVLEGLRTLGLEENTLLIFTPDHGLALPRAKCSLYDPGLSVALIVRFPGRGWTGGRREADLVSNVDIFPTILDALEIAIDPRVEGRSFRPLLDGEAYAPRDCVFGEMTYHDYYDPVRCIRTDRYKLIANFTTAPSFMNPSQSWRPRCDPVVPPFPPVAYHVPVELYDLQADPGEQRNLADDLDHVEVRRDLLQRLGRWMAATEDPLLQGAVTPPTHRRVLAELRGV